jgi:hypothetical protein
MDCFEYERFFVKKPNERLFLALFAVQTGKKRFREKNVFFFCEFTRIEVKNREFSSTVVG